MLIGGIFAIGIGVLLVIGGAGACWDSAARRGRSGPLWGAVGLGAGGLAFAFAARLLFDLDDTAAPGAVWVAFLAAPTVPVVVLGGLAYLIHALPAVTPRVGARVPVFRLSGGGVEGYEATLAIGDGELVLEGGAEPERFTCADLDARVDGECLRLDPNGRAGAPVLLRPRAPDRSARARLAQALARRLQPCRRR